MRATSTLEHEVLRLCGGGRAAQACQRILEALGTELKTYLRSQLADDSLGDDAYQELSLVVLQNVHRFEARSTIRTWLYGIAHNLVRRKRQQRLGSAEISLPLEELDAIPAARAGALPGHAPVSSVEASLNWAQREAFALRVAFGFSYREIGALTGVSSDTAKARCLRARRRLQRLLLDEGDAG